MKYFKLSFLLIFLMLFQVPALLADEKTEEIKSLIEIAEMKLEKLKKEGGESYADEEIKIIARSIKDAREAIKNNQEERALLIISLGMAYFKKIDAKKDLINAERELNLAKSRYNQQKENEK